jgi:hydroxymethylpyrimidine/phosphomethylpyrimidine kinase
MKEDALDTIRESLLPLATIITPNLPEAGILLRKSVATMEDQEAAVEELTSIFGVATYLKGGHLENTRTHRDLLKENGKLHVFEHEHLELPQTHGTGCTLSAALAAAISSGSSLAHAGKEAHQFTQQALRDSESWNSPTSGEVIFHLRQAQQLNALTEN